MSQNCWSVFGTPRIYDRILFSEISTSGFGKRYEPGQGNNAYIFPGLSLGIISAGIRHVHESVFLFAAEGLADLVTEEDLSLGRMYPPLSKIKNVSIKIATKVVQEAYREGMASTYPEPEVSAFNKSIR